MMLATEYAKYHDMEPQGDNESDEAFKSRVAHRLREMGRIIEAHEVYQDAFHDQNENVVAGILGYVAQAMAGKHYDGDPIGNDIAAGHGVQKPDDDISPEIATLILSLFG
jgi:hypothetical protein